MDYTVVTANADKGSRTLWINVHFPLTVLGGR